MPASCDRTSANWSRAIRRFYNRRKALGARESGETQRRFQRRDRRARRTLQHFHALWGLCAIRSLRSSRSSAMNRFSAAIRVELSSTSSASSAASNYNFPMTQSSLRLRVWLVRPIGCASIAMVAIAGGFLLTVLSAQSAVEPISSRQEGRRGRRLLWNEGRRPVPMDGGSQFPGSQQWVDGAERRHVQVSRVAASSATGSSAASLSFGTTPCHPRHDTRAAVGSIGATPVFSARPSYYGRRSLGGPETLVLDPNALSPDGSIALSGFEPSPDGRYFAYGQSEGGSDWSTYFVRELDSAENS